MFFHFVAGFVRSFQDQKFRFHLVPIRFDSPHLRYQGTRPKVVWKLGIGRESHTTPKHIRFNYAFQDPPTDKYYFVTAKAAKGNDQNTKPNSVICGDCDGNGAIQCSQCKGNGVNSVDIFDGKFKAGDSCWLCGGRKEMLCGNCNGAGFVGGFLSTYDQ